LRWQQFFLPLCCIGDGSTSFWWAFAFSKQLISDESARQKVVEHRLLRNRKRAEMRSLQSCEGTRQLSMAYVLGDGRRGC
jgi:hypothetical protein